MVHGVKPGVKVHEALVPIFSVPKAFSIQSNHTLNGSQKVAATLFARNHASSFSVPFEIMDNEQGMCDLFCRNYWLGLIQIRGVESSVSARRGCNGKEGE